VLPRQGHGGEFANFIVRPRISLKCMLAVAVANSMTLSRYGDMCECIKRGPHNNML